ncbi:MAG: ketoacid CoA transferase, partial [Rhodospirillales bacterium]|nr:ketoacid CoA transferase [Rhodospirillales bacterium]
ITDRCVMRPYGPDHELHVVGLHRGNRFEDIHENTGWDVKASPEIAEIAPPSAAELASLAEVDRDGFWS